MIHASHPSLEFEGRSSWAKFFKSNHGMKRKKEEDKNVIQLSQKECVSKISQENVSTLQSIIVKNRQQATPLNGSRIKTDGSISTSQDRTEETNARTRFLSLPFTAEADDPVRGSVVLSGDPAFLCDSGSAFLSNGGSALLPTGGSTVLGDGGSGFLSAGDSGVIGDGDCGLSGLSGERLPLFFFEFLICSKNLETLVRGFGLSSR